MKRFACFVAIVALQLLCASALAVFVIGVGTLFPHSPDDSVVILGVALALLGMGLNALIALVKSLFMPSVSRLFWWVLLLLETAGGACALFLAYAAHHQVMSFIALSLSMGFVLSAIVGGITTTPTHVTR